MQPTATQPDPLPASHQPAGRQPATSGTPAPLKAPRLQNWKLTVAYDGTGFNGWQVQPDCPTVQGELQAALGRICGEQPLPQGSGRTDAGVHALAQVASFPLAATIPAASLARALNRTLPAAIRVLEARPVASGFHARHSAHGKTYEYQIFAGALCPPFLARYAFDLDWPLELERLNAAAALFLGEHDFLSFAASNPAADALRAAGASPKGIATPGTDPAAETKESPAPSALASPSSLLPTALVEDEEKEKIKFPPGGGKVGAIRTIYTSEWERRESDFGPLLVYRVRGNGFLHHMVRNLVGTMIEVGRGRMPVAALPAILAARRRSAAGPTAPPQGLFLHSVDYNEADQALPDPTSH